VVQISTSEGTFLSYSLSRPIIVSFLSSSPTQQHRSAAAYHHHITSYLTIDCVPYYALLTARIIIAPSRQKKGKYTRLAGRHAAYNIGTSAAHQWVNYMTEALKEHETLSTDDEARASLLKYFTYTAHYIVAASVYMRPDQLSGGTQIDPGRIW